MVPPKALFDEDDEAVPEGQLRVNEEYAKRFEHNKKREELHRLQEKYPEQAARLAKKHAQRATTAAAAQKQAGEPAGGDEVESSSEEEEEEDPEKLLSSKTQAQIFETLLKIRSKDASIYQPDTKFYSSEEEEEEEDEEGGEGAGKAGKKKERPMYLKDVIYQQALQEGGTSSDEEGSEGGRAPQRTYAQEQDELKRAFLTAFEENDGAGGGGEGEDFGAGVLKQRGRKGRQGEDGEEGGDEGEGSGRVAGGASGGGADAEARVQQLLDGYFGRDEELSKEDRFLKRYILNKGWVEEGDDGFDGEDGGEEDDPHAQDTLVEEDEEDLERMEQFEHAYNFRFEEPGAAAIITYPRNVEGTVRKEDDRRKRKRQEKAARLAEEEERRRAEVKRLKNLKKAEIEEKLQEIQTVAGKAAPPEEMLDQLMAGDFDPEEYDKQMAAAFGDDYYAAGPDEDDDDDLADEEFEKELEAMAQYGSEDEDPRSFAALHKRLREQRQADKEAGSDDDDGSGEAEDGDGASAADKEAAAKARAEVQRLLEEYYKLDYEDVVGGIPTRFRYKEVGADTFGLSVEDILAMEDKELNQVVGLKKLAPYREEYKRVRPNYGKLNELRKQREEQQGPGRRGSGGGSGKQPWKQGQQGGWKQGSQQGGKRDGLRQAKPPGQAQEQGRGEREQRPKKTAEELRLESYNKPSLKKGGQQQQGGGGGGVKRKRDGDGDGSGGQQQQQGKPKQQSKPKQQQQQQQPADDGPKLSKAAKKNMKRAEKRAAKRSKVGDGGAE